MTRTGRFTFDVGHPAPGKRRVGALMLWACFLAGPLMWSLQLGANSSIAGLSCIARDGTNLDTSLHFWSQPTIIFFNIVALAVSVLALLLSLWNLRRGQQAAREAGAEMKADRGRARFMALWGIWTSVLFLFAIAFNTVAVFYGGLCPS